VEDLKSQTVTSKPAIPPERIERRILLIRGQKVMLDADLAELYEVSTKRLNEQVRRNSDRFPEDFMFTLTEEETGILRSQIAALTSALPIGGGARTFHPEGESES
jgi:hypothetical protein